MNRDDLFLKAADKLRADFEESRVMEHAGVKGGEAEKLVRKFLNDHLPGRFRAGAGFIVDHKGAASQQTDVVIYDALNCPVYRLSDDGSVFPSDNVAAVIEVKSLLDKAKLNDAWQNIAVVKSLYKTPNLTLNPLTVTETIGLVFAFKCAGSAASVTRNYAELLREKGLGRHVDAILILDQALLRTSLRLPGITMWFDWTSASPRSEQEGTHIAVSTTMGPHTLDDLFRMLLEHLVHFRASVDRPPEGVSDRPRTMTYATSVTKETNPKRRDAVLDKYRAECEAELRREDQQDAI